MSSKKELIDYINAREGGALHSSNTSYSKINISKEVWWLNVPTHKFNGAVNLLLKANKKVIWVQLPKGFVNNIAAYFKIRPDRDAVDLEISADKNYMYLRDVKSGGTGFDFSGFVKDTIQF
tara:strand:- start:6550 stop:6912 length:363 start_codon:yes stop_codon:yes gene_type:complete